MRSPHTQITNMSQATIYNVFKGYKLNKINRRARPIKTSKQVLRRDMELQRTSQNRVVKKYNKEKQP